MKTHSIIITTLLLASLLSTGCTAQLPAPQSDIIPTLPADRRHAPHALIPIGDGWLGFVHHRSGDSYLLELDCDRKLLPAGHRLDVQLIGTPYSTANGSKWQHQLGSITTTGIHQFTLSESDFRKNGGPYDYRVSFTLRQTGGKEVDTRDTRLTDHMPGPGYPTWYEQENRESLHQLQQAAEQCHKMKLLLRYHHNFMIDSPMELPLSTADSEVLRSLIARMKPVKTHLHEVIPAFGIDLQLLGADGKELANFDPFDVTAARHVSPEGAADMSSYTLSNEDAATWFSIIYGPAVKNAIKQAEQRHSKSPRQRRRK